MIHNLSFLSIMLVVCFQMLPIELEFTINGKELDGYADNNAFSSYYGIF